MIVISSLVTLPLLLALCMIDGFLTLVALRFIAARIDADWARRALPVLQTFTDALPRAAQRRLSSWFSGDIPTWAGWTAIVVVLLSMRAVLASIIISLGR